MPADAPPAGFVVDLPAYRKPRKGGWHGVNTRQQFNKILVRAGIGLIKNAFKVFRSLCVTDWARDHAVLVVAAWAGHMVSCGSQALPDLIDSDRVKATSPVTTLTPILAITGPSISQAGEVVGESGAQSPENTDTSVTQKVTQKVTYSVQEMAGKDGNDENGQKPQVVDLLEVTATCQILPNVSNYPARIRTRLKKLGKTKVFQYRISKRISQADQC